MIATRETIPRVQQAGRRIIVLGGLEAAGITENFGSGSGWRLVGARTLEDAEALLGADRDLRVGLCTVDAGLCGESQERVSALFARYGSVQWIALLPAGCAIDERLAALLAHDFFDYLTLPVDPQRLFAWAGHAYGRSLVVERARGRPVADEEQMVGTSEVMRQLFRAIRKVAACAVPVLISGESGTGKELCARAIHERSPRSKGPFVALDCGALPPSLIQAELFGYEKGAFTGAAQRRAGRIECAHGGTLVLDEIGDLPLDMQGNLLRFLQESTVQRLGSTRPITVDTRVIAATHVDLEDAVRQGRFREDLYYRLNVLRLHTPALREREGDIEVLARYFLGQFLKDSRKKVLGYTTGALDAMRRHSWPGNIRELINRVRRATVMCEGQWIAPRDLDLEQPAAQEARLLDLDQARAAAERKALGQALKLSDNNFSAAARLLGISRVTLYRLLEKHHLASQPVAG